MFNGHLNIMVNTVITDVTDDNSKTICLHLFISVARTLMNSLLSFVGLSTDGHRGTSSPTACGPPPSGRQFDCFNSC